VGLKGAFLALFLNPGYVAALYATEGRNMEIFDIFSAKIYSATNIWSIRSFAGFQVTI
jgi:hypothetical protein